MDNIVMSIFYRQSCLVCTPFRQLVTVPCFGFTTGRKFFWDGNSDFLTEMEKLNQNVIYKLTDGLFFLREIQLLL